MGEHFRFYPDSTSREGHPAVQAWAELGGPEPARGAIDVLRTSTGKPTKKVSSLYRLNGVGKSGAAVVAKRQCRRNLLIERRVYQDILPAVPVRSLHCYGFIEEKGSDFGWLFLEDAGGEKYSNSVAEHRTLAAEWLGLLHGSTGRLDLSGLLPPIGPERYLCCLRLAHQTIREHLSNPALDREQRALLRTILGHCDAIESSWEAVTRFYDAMPRCLVHGDFLGHNARVRADATGPALYVLDWERAGWGVAAEDIGELDMAIYGPRIRDSWPHLDLQTLEELANLGTIFRYLCLIEGTSPALACEWVEDTVADLEVYECRLARARQVARGAWRTPRP